MSSQFKHSDMLKQAGDREASCCRLNSGIIVQFGRSGKQRKKTKKKQRWALMQFFIESPPRKEALRGVLVNVTGQHK